MIFIQQYLKENGSDLFALYLQMLLHEELLDSAPHTIRINTKGDKTTDLEVHVRHVMDDYWSGVWGPIIVVSIVLCAIGVWFYCWCKKSKQPEQESDTEEQSGLLVQYTQR